MQGQDDDYHHPVALSHSELKPETVHLIGVLERRHLGDMGSSQKSWDWNTRDGATFTVVVKSAVQRSDGSLACLQKPNLWRQRHVTEPCVPDFNTCKKAPSTAATENEPQ